MNCSVIVRDSQALLAERVRAAFRAEIDDERLTTYRLPVDPAKRVLVGISGGADSGVLGLFAGVYLAPHYPRMEFIFTDTLDEPPSCYDTLRAIEEFTGIPVTRLSDGKGLFGLIEQYNGFLPSTRSRYCTRQLKVVPLLEYMAATRDAAGDVSLAGIRYDEADRDGISFVYTMENGTAAFPLIDLGVTRDMVFRILEKTIGIPAIYAYKSRSGCASCFFQRYAEYVGMLAHDPDSFERSESVEKLSAADALRWQNIPVPLSQQGIQATYPVPVFIDIRKQGQGTLPEPVTARKRRAKDAATADLFDVAPESEESTTVFAAFALYCDERLGWFGGREFSPGVYWQEFVTLSTSLTGLKNSLSQYHRFRQSTPLPHLNAKDLRIVLVMLQFPVGSIDMEPPAAESYTWKHGMALKQLRHVVGHCRSALEYHALLREHQDTLALLDSTNDPDVWCVADERKERIERDLGGLQAVAGKVMWEGLYAPREPAKGLQLDLLATTGTAPKVAREGLEFDEVPMACLACSL